MAQEELASRLLDLPTPAAQQRFLEEHANRLDDQVAEALKQKADETLRADVQRSLQIVDLMLQMAAVTGNPFHRALGLLAEGNARSIGVGEYAQALACYEEAAAIYGENGDLVRQARSQIGKVTVLMGGTYEADTRVFTAAGITAVGQRLMISAAVTVDTLTKSGLIVHDGTATKEIVGYVTRLPANNGGKLRFMQTLV